MDNEGTICENCNKRVPSENYEIHFVHCKRNIVSCSLCGEATLRSEEKQHFEENHAEINCVQCGQKTTRSEEGNHLANDCGKRPIPCPYCELRLPRERMREHQEFCGSRTEFCHECSRYVLVRDFVNHESACDGGSNDRRLDLPVSLPCEFCGSLMQLDELDAHQRDCQRLEETEDLQIPLVVEDVDGVFREVVRTPDHFTSSDTDDDIETESEDNSIVALPCEICGELWPSDRLMEHQEQCIQEREGVQGSRTASESEEPLHGSDLPHFRFSRLHQNLFNNGGEGDSFTFTNFTMEGARYDLLANVFRDMEDPRWPFEMMRNIWSRT